MGLDGAEVRRCAGGGEDDVCGLTSDPCCVVHITAAVVVVDSHAGVAAPAKACGLV